MTAEATELVDGGCRHCRRRATNIGAWYVSSDRPEEFGGIEHPAYDDGDEREFEARAGAEEWMSA